MAITPGAGGSCGEPYAANAAFSCNFPLASRAGDVLVAGLNGNKSNPRLSGMCGATFSHYGPMHPNLQYFVITAQNLSQCSEDVFLQVDSGSGSYDYSFLAQIYSSVERITSIVQNSTNTPITGNGLVTSLFSVNVEKPGSVVVSEWYLNNRTAVVHFPSMRVFFNMGFARYVLVDTVVDEVGPYYPQINFTGATQSACLFAAVLEEMEPPSEGKITVGAGSSCGLYASNSAAFSCDFPLPSQAGDVLVAGTNGKAVPRLSGMCGATFVRYGPVAFSQTYGWSAINLSQCSEHIYLQTDAPGMAGGFGFLAQVYRGVESIASFIMASSNANVNGSGLVTATFSVNVTKPQSVVVSHWFITGAAVTFNSPTRTTFATETGRFAITDAVVDQIGPYFPQIDYSGGTAFNCRWIALLEPKEIEPPSEGEEVFGLSRYAQLVPGVTP